MDFMTLKGDFIDKCDENSTLKEENKQFRKKYLSLLKQHRNVKRMGRRILEVAPRVIKCTSVEWDDATTRFRKAVKEKEDR